MDPPESDKPAKPVLIASTVHKFAPAPGADVWKFREAVRKAGYDDFVDHVAIYRADATKFIETVQVQIEAPPYFPRLISYIRDGALTLRVEIRINDPAATLERALAVNERLKDRESRTRGLFRSAFKGVVAEGRGKGSEQVWFLDYYP